MRRALITSLLIGFTAASFAQNPSRISQAHPGRNVIIFVADGMRHGSVNSQDSPTMLALRQRGVHFIESHSLFPTFTTANASAIATGHFLGDTGDYSNTIYIGYPLPKPNAGKVTPFLENDAVLRDLDDHYAGNFLHETSLMAMARAHGYNTAVIGKVGPVGVQDASQLRYEGTAPLTVFFDDQTGTAEGIPLPTTVLDALTAAKLPHQTPTRANGCKPKSPCDNGYAGTDKVAGTSSPNSGQQQYFADALTQAVLPLFIGNGKPFAVLFWSRDPDGTQHNQGDSLNTLSPGINGPTSRAAIHNADKNLKQILDFLTAHPDVAANTDVFLTSDHGYATISRHTVDPAGTPTSSYAAGFAYPNAQGELEVGQGFLPQGFIAIDLAHALHLPLYDPDTLAAPDTYAVVDPAQTTGNVLHRPASGNGILGGAGKVRPQTDAQVIVAENGGSDLIYVPTHDPARVREIVRFLTTQDYVGALFVDDRYGSIPGALPLSAVGLHGDAVLPQPDITVSFRTFYQVPGDLMSAVQIADTALHQGQGMHGSFGRDNTFNNMAAFGPDFKASFEDTLPVSNADITPTLAYILGFEQANLGPLSGRVLNEALTGRAPGKRHSVAVRRVSAPSAGGVRTVLHARKVGATTYFDEACLVRTRKSAANECR